MGASWIRGLHCCAHWTKLLAVGMVPIRLGAVDPGLTQFPKALIWWSK
uniref:Uncharacterized protein n=1 Tax=Physcomitrium patens TaxID=3218 RepID=A0A2K1JH77_PHYPA|nr:hypothetical protein PHYPA_018310 [Physcomitrium patens]